MTVVRHGLSVGIERVGDEFFMSFKVMGTLTHSDYEAMTPMIDAALAGVQGAHVKALVDATELQGWELRAAWDDLKLGLKHGAEFERIALVSDSRWLEVAAKVGAWFMTGELKVFTTQDAGVEGALEWLNDTEV